MNQATQHLVGANLELMDGYPVHLLDVVRVIPGRRVVASAQWNGQSVFVKIFFGQDSQKYAKRDADGIVILQQAHIATPRMLYVGAGTLSTGEQVQVIVLEAIQSSKNIEALLPTLEPQACLALAKRLMSVIARHHAADILHTDLHLKNFLVADNIIYTLDGDGVRRHVGLTDKKALDNLAEMISKFDVLEQVGWLPQLLEAYHATISWPQPITAAQITPLAHRYRLKAVSDYADKKVFRTCTDVSVAQSAGVYQAWSNAFDFSQDVDLDGLIANGQLLKSGNTCTVALAAVGGKEIVIKRYNIKSTIHALSRALRSSRAAASWSNAHRMKLLGIPTAAPIALLESRRFGVLRGKAYFLSEYVNAPDALTFFAQMQDVQARTEAINHIVQLFYKLYLLQISHGDTKATNIKMQGVAPLLLDLDSMRQHRHSCIKAHVRDLKRFMKNWEDDNALYNAFVKTFRTVYQDASPLRRAGIFYNKELTE